ncbi:hypothetical protein H072_5911 [Dactylellina haptotyla CBS 200.50]|uniref:Centromere protein H C-terminal domain-containing protein n=1 Tax=Dactylellina haptotyla (strain CBS 200.50) TaxID=1284197 RepID=S8AGL4_DACHA|nr:hypothetical protein H072_5911 [Dactylellina haptotyla CBS 200.50]
MAAESLRSTCISIITELMNQKIGFPILPPPTSSSTQTALQSLSTHQDKEVLARYDKLQELTLQRHLLEAELEALQEALSNDSMDVDDTSSLEAAKKATLETQGKILVKDLVVTQMVSTRPIVRAVHSGPNRTKLETDLLPLLTTRDLLATTLLQLTSQLSTLQQMYTQSSTALIKHTNTNRELAERVRQLSAANEFTESITGNERVVAKKAEMMKEQRRCQTLKGVVQGIIVGSGVNWAEDETLRRLVLECGDD